MSVHAYEYIWLNSSCKYFTEDGVCVCMLVNIHG